MKRVTRNKSLTIHALGVLEEDASTAMASHALSELKRGEMLIITSERYIPFHAVEYANVMQMSSGAVVGTAIVGHAQVG